MVRYNNPEILPPPPDPSPAALAAWLAELPLANTARCLDALLATLKHQSADDAISPAIRFKLTAMLAPYVDMLADRTDNPLLEVSMPRPTAIQTAELGAALYRETALAYALAYAPKPSPVSHWSHDEPGIDTAPARSLRYWGRYLLRRAQLYEHPEAGFWTSIYGVYRRAEQAGLVAVTDETPNHRTARGLFKRIILFALSDTGRLRPRDMRNVYGLLGAMADHAVLAQHPRLREGPGHFQVDMDKDAPPTICPAKQVLRSSLYFLDVVALVERLVKDPPPDATSSFDAPQFRHLKRVLAKGLYVTKGRKSTRIPADHQCRLYIGLPDIIRALSAPVRDAGNPKSELPLSHLAPIDWTQRSRFKLEPLESDWRGRAAKIERSLRDEATENIILEEWREAADPVWDTPPAYPAADNAVQGTLLNTGPSGYCVTVAEAAHPSIQIGVPVGIMEEGEPLFLGTIRWLTREPEGLKFGLKLLAPKMEVVEIRAFGGGAKGKGLLLPADPVLRPEPELLVLPTVFDVSTQLTIKRRLRPEQAYLGDLRERTLSFSRLRLCAPHAEGEAGD